MIGIDEVGRGSWAGPLLVVAARMNSALPIGLNDSKLLTKTKRQKLLPEIMSSCDVGEGWVEPAEIDALGLTSAMKLGVERALIAIAAEHSEEIIMDGAINYCEPHYSHVRCVVKADALHPIVSAASIYAKATRDAFMSTASGKYPNFGFESHVGYGTKSHIDALAAYGVTPLHRLSYKPVKAYL